MAESIDTKPTLVQAAPLVASAIEQSLDDAGSAVEDISSLLKDVESLEPMEVGSTVAAFHDLTEQTRAIDHTARSASTASTTHREPASGSGEASALSQADQALAKDLDALMQGDFESIDAVLDGVFEEQAVLVQATEHTKAKTPKQMETESAASRETDQVHEAQPTVREAAPAAMAPTMIAPVSELTSAPHVEVAAKPTTAPPVPIAAAVPAVTASAPISPSTPVSTTLAQAQPMSAAIVADVATPISTPIAVPPHATTPSPSPRRTIKIRINPTVITGPLGKIAFQVLSLINLPMKFVPAKLKGAVDIVALSLVLWVPLAFILPPKIAAWQAARAAASHTTGAVHAESSNTGHAAPADDDGGGSHGGGGHDAPKGHGGGH